MQLDFLFCSSLLKIFSDPIDGLAVIQTLQLLRHVLNINAGFLRHSPCIFHDLQFESSSLKRPLNKMENFYNSRAAVAFCECVKVVKNFSF